MIGNGSNGNDAGADMRPDDTWPTRTDSYG